MRLSRSSTQVVAVFAITGVLVGHHNAATVFTMKRTQSDVDMDVDNFKMHFYIYMKLFSQQHSLPHPNVNL